MSTVKVEPFTVGNFVHAFNRGINKTVLFREKSDYWRFLWSLRFFNDERDIEEFARCLTDLVSEQKEILRDLRGLNPRENSYLDGRNTFEWRAEWGQQRPIVEIVSYCLMPNHFHLLLREIVEGGISKFMKKIGAGYTLYRNTKNHEIGPIFQGGYRGKTVTDEKYLQYLDAYIQVFNAIELFEGGIRAAIENFDQAFEFALDYPFSSLGESFGKRNLSIVKRDCFNGVFDSLDNYKKFCQDALLTRSIREFLGKLTME